VKAYNEYMNTGTVFKDVGISYTDVLDSWMENYVRIRCAPATIENYENMINNHIRPAFGCYRVTAIQHESIQVFINRLFDEGYYTTKCVFFCKYFSRIYTELANIF